MKKFIVFLVVILALQACSSNKNMKKAEQKEPDIKIVKVPKADNYKAYPPAKRTKLKIEKLKQEKDVMKIEAEISRLQKILTNLRIELAEKRPKINTDGITEDDLIEIDKQINLIEKEIIELKRLKYFVNEKKVTND